MKECCIPVGEHKFERRLDNLSEKRQDALVYDLFPFSRANFKIFDAHCVDSTFQVPGLMEKKTKRSIQALNAQVLIPIHHHALSTLDWCTLVALGKDSGETWTHVTHGPEEQMDKYLTFSYHLWKTTYQGWTVDVQVITLPSSLRLAQRERTTG